MNKALLLCARDIENMYHKGIPYHKALRHMQYLIAPYEVSRATKELARIEKGKTAQYEQYTSDLINKGYHDKKMKGARA